MAPPPRCPTTSHEHAALASEINAEELARNYRNLPEARKLAKAVEIYAMQSAEVSNAGMAAALSHARLIRAQDAATAALVALEKAAAELERVEKVHRPHW